MDSARDYFNEVSQSREFIHRLTHLTSFLKQISTDLIPHNHSNFLEVHRALKIWSLFSSKNIRLDEGGIEESISIDTPLPKYHGYIEQAGPSQNDIKKFLLDERAIEENTNIDFIYINFSLGSHNGFIQTLKTLYHPLFSNQLFFPEFAYGLFYMAAIRADYSPIFLASDKKNGEKINFTTLLNNIKKHKDCKILYLDAKTTAGVFYTELELIEIIDVCKKHSIFLIYDISHLGLELHSSRRQLSITLICQQKNYFSYVILYTASKTYGLEKGRVGFCISDTRNKVRCEIDRQVSFAQKNSENNFLYFGLFPTQSLILANSLITLPHSYRKEFRKRICEKHSLNLAIMIAYIEGVNSENIAHNLRDTIKEIIPCEYHIGIKSISLITIPLGGFQLKIDLCTIIGKFFFHFQITSSETVYYLLSAFYNVVVLYGPQILDFSSTQLRLSFCSQEKILIGMSALFKFMSLITDAPIFIGENKEIFSFKIERQKNIIQVINKSRKDQELIDSIALLTIYKDNFLRLVRFKFFFINDKKIEELLSILVMKIQTCWRNTCHKKSKKDIITKKKFGLFGNIYESVFNNRETTLAFCIAGVSLAGLFICRKNLANLVNSCVLPRVQGP